MKKIIIFTVIVLGLGFGVQYWPQIRSITTRIPKGVQQLQESQIVVDLKKDVSTPGPLRNKIESSRSFLTVSGTIQWTNKNRADNNLPVLKENQILNQAAQKKLDDMFAQQYFDHVNPQGNGPSNVVDSVQYEYVAVGENLALGNFKDDQALVEAWMNSPGHRANILSGKFTEIGVAVGKGKYEGKTTWLAVQTFAKPASACPRVDNTLKDQILSVRSEIDSLEHRFREIQAELEAMDPKTKEEYNAYNAKVKQYNDLVKIYNNKIDQQKQLVSQYNAQVKAFNECVGK